MRFAALAVATAIAAAFGCAGRCDALGIATISVSGSMPVTWSNAGTSDLYLAADGGSLTVTGTMQTTAVVGSGSLTITAPASFTGAHGAPLPLGDISVTCSGAAVAGQTFVASRTPLVAGSPVTCATYAAGFVSVNLNVTVTFFLNDTTLQADAFNSASTAFSITANAS